MDLNNIKEILERLKASSKNDGDRLSKIVLLEKLILSNQMSKYSTVKKVPLPMNYAGVMHPFGRDDLKQILKSQFAIKNERKLNIAVLHGIGGIGKTRLASYYAQVSSYDIVIWFPAHDIKNSFREMINKVVEQLPLPNDFVEYPDLVYFYLQSCRNVLFIFDDVQDYKSVQPYLPFFGDVIITSRHNNTSYNCIEVPALTEGPAVDLLIAKIINYDNQRKFSLDDKKLLSQLAKQLYGLPFCLELAGTTIGQSKKNIKTYVDELEKSKASLFNKTLLDSDQTVALMVLQTLQQASEKQPLVKRMVKYCAYLDENHIPYYLLKEILAEKLQQSGSKPDDVAKLVEPIIEALCAYNLITKVNEKNDDQYFYFHPLILEVMRIHFIKEAPQLSLTALGHLNKLALEDVTRKSELSTHFIQLIKYMQKIKDQAGFYSLRFVAEINNTGLIHQSLEDQPAAFECFNYAIHLLKSVKIDNKEFYLASLLNNTGLSLAQLKDYPEALKCMQLSLAKKKEIFKDIANKSLGFAYFNLAVVKMNMQQYQLECLDDFKQARSIFSNIYGKAHVYVIQTLINMAQTYISNNKAAEAKNILEELLGLLNNLNDIELKINLHETLASLNYEQGNIKEAINQFLSAEKICPLHNQMVLLRIKRNLANCYNQQVDYDSAIKTLHSAISMIEQTLVETQTDKVKNQANKISILAFTYVELAGSYRAGKQLENAIIYYDKALSNWKKLRDSYHIATTFLNLGDVSLDLNRYEAAINYFDEALKIYVSDQFPEQAIHAHCQLAMAYHGNKDNEKTIYHFNCAYNLAKTKLGETHDRTKQIADAIINVKKRAASNGWVRTVYTLGRPAVVLVNAARKGSNVISASVSAGGTYLVYGTGVLGERTGLYNRETGEYWAGWVAWGAEAGVGLYLNPVGYGVGYAVGYATQYAANKIDVNISENPEVNGCLQILKGEATGFVSSQLTNKVGEAIEKSDSTIEDKQATEQNTQPAKQKNSAVDKLQSARDSMNSKIPKECQFMHKQQQQQQIGGIANINGRSVPIQSRFINSQPSQKITVEKVDGRTIIKSEPWFNYQSSSIPTQSYSYKNVQSYRKLETREPSDFEYLSMNMFMPEMALAHLVFNFDFGTTGLLIKPEELYERIELKPHVSHSFIGQSKCSNTLHPGSNIGFFKITQDNGEHDKARSRINVLVNHFQ